jgi:mRNA interferase RelE/StbE
VSVVSRYRVAWTHRAEKDLRKLGPDAQFRVRRAVELLGEDPRRPGVKSLTARSEFRLRVGDFRVLFEIRDDIVLVLIVAVRKREDAY